MNTTKNVSKIQENIVSKLEKISNNYNSIIFHNIEDLERLERGEILIGDAEQTDFELTRLEEIDELKNDELIPVLRANKLLCLRLWTHFNDIEERYLKE